MCFFASKTFKLGAIISLISTVLIISSNCAQSVTQYGITWEFSEDRPVGQFVNGDWWVQLPVTITKITPATEGGYQGSMINPTPFQSNGLSQGGTGGAFAYDPAKNVGLLLPYEIQTACSLVSTIGQPDYTAQKTLFKETAVLTCLSATPAVGSFRPPYAGADKTIKSNWNLSQMSYAPFKTVTPSKTAHIPNRTWLEDATVRPLQEYEESHGNSQWKAADSSFPRRTYGREISNISAAAGIYLNLNVSNETKKRLLINMCQWGIDVHGLINNGMKWSSNGGHQLGRKLPLFIAAKALGDASMLEDCNANHYGGFQEDTGHWFVTQKDIDTPRVPISIPPYTLDMLGMPEWGPGPWEREKHSPLWNLTGYRFINGGPNCAAVLCVSLMGGRADYGNEAYFRYIIERYYPLQKIYAGGTVPNYNDGIQPIVVDLWDRYILGLAEPSKIQQPKGLKPLTR